MCLCLCVCVCVCVYVYVCSCGITQLQGPLWQGAKSITIQIQVALPLKFSAKLFGVYCTLWHRLSHTRMHTGTNSRRYCIHGQKLKNVLWILPQQVNIYILAYSYSQCCICNSVRAVKPTVYLAHALEKLHNLREKKKSWIYMLWYVWISMRNTAVFMVHFKCFPFKNAWILDFLHCLVGMNPSLIPPSLFLFFFSPLIWTTPQKCEHIK